ncbi:MAG: hypothetical protein QOD88_214 [Mycobacterium sp.]|jgi:hypothetical protein|nr:hypothetical protein [Mycobacterium sp.]
MLTLALLCLVGLAIAVAFTFRSGGSNDDSTSAAFTTEWAIADFRVSPCV